MLTRSWKSTHFGGHAWVLHCTTVDSGREAALQSDSSTSAPVKRFLHVGTAILYPGEVDVMNWFLRDWIAFFLCEKLNEHNSYLLRTSPSTPTCRQSPNDRVAASKFHCHRHKPHRNQSSSSIRCGDRSRRAIWWLISEVSVKWFPGRGWREGFLLLFKWSVVFIMDWEAFLFLLLRLTFIYANLTLDDMSHVYKRHKIWMRLFSLLFLFMPTISGLR